MIDVFNVQIFFVVFRESLEAIVVVSVLLAFIKQGLGGAQSDPAINKRLTRQVWWGSILGVSLCLILGTAFIAVFYTIGNDIWSSSEDLWEGIFCIFASMLISVMGIAMLRINKMKEKWRVKLAQALLKQHENKKDRWNLRHLTTKYCMFVLPFITCLREGLEAVVFVGGVGLNKPASSFPIPVICGLIAGIFVGWILYYFGSTSKLQVFLIISTSILYLISAGLFSRGIWGFEEYRLNVLTGGDIAEVGSGPGSYDISKSVWHVNCCNPEIDNGWDVFNSLLGWENSATYGSVISYNLYWLMIILVLLTMLYEEKHGHLPGFRSLKARQLNPMYYIKGKKNEVELTEAEKEALFNKVHAYKLEEESPDTSITERQESIADSVKNEKNDVVEIQKEL